MVKSTLILTNEIFQYLKSTKVKRKKKDFENTNRFVNKQTSKCALSTTQLHTII